MQLPLSMWYSYQQFSKSCASRAAQEPLCKQRLACGPVQAETCKSRLPQALAECGCRSQTLNRTSCPKHQPSKGDAHQAFNVFLQSKTTWTRHRSDFPEIDTPRNTRVERQTHRLLQQGLPIRMLCACVSTTVKHLGGNGHASLEGFRVVPSAFSELDDTTCPFVGPKAVGACHRVGFEATGPSVNCNKSTA